MKKYMSALSTLPEKGPGRSSFRACLLSFTRLSEPGEEPSLLPEPGEPVPKPGEPPREPGKLVPMPGEAGPGEPVKELGDEMPEPGDGSPMSPVRSPHPREWAGSRRATPRRLSAKLVRSPHEGGEGHNQGTRQLQQGGRALRDELSRLREPASFPELAN
ncbi:hypothetical protein P7K49_012836 [Saguinus oedipus]|uniref:Uncharacterized protein n=1 Tax=Saguinus oedipus TaxID=9490 RepID=A0ABQ9VEH4_SAGOE|nr:hypothetical protein P7K49_012836 [Saguinus oedipus]